MTPDLKPGDVLLYAAGHDFFSWAIRLKTWHPVSHVEVSIGGGESVASRNGIGVNRYPTRYDGLAYVLRPTVPFQRGAALDWFTRHAKGLPYSWIDLANFLGVNIDKRGMFCSEFATLVLRAGGVPVFNAEPAIKVAPCEFLLSELLQTIWSLEAAPVAAEG